jgi:hypothetical protein
LQSVSLFPSLGAAAGYAILGVGEGNFGDTVHLSASTTNGNVGVAGPNGALDQDAPGVVNGNIYLNTGTTIIESHPGVVSGTIFTGLDLTQAVTDAKAASSSAAALFTTAALGNVNGAETVTGNGGLNVITIGDLVLNNDDLLLSGGVGDKFVINITGKLDLTGNAIIGGLGGVDASDILINVLGTGTTLTTHVDDMINGTLLSLNRSITFHGTTGAIIAGGITVDSTTTIMSGATINYVALQPPSVPLPASVWGGFALLGGLGLTRLRRFRSTNA